MASGAGIPIRSKLTLRSKICLSASGEGVRPFSSNFCKMKLSIGFRIQDAFLEGKIPSNRLLGFGIDGCLIV